ncbi:MAG: enoyl-CoA hydratase/isomerase family protein [Aquamicrobium sp.]|nr:enoyl-CoA hydratase/isomerase family protein [Aquamicrobium sp.]
MNSNPEVLVWNEGSAGRIHLNRPKALNALNNGMVRLILRALSEFEAQDHIRAVVVTAEGGKSFCAGGDLKEIYHLARQDRDLAVRIWSEEYILNARIASCSKPWVCLVDGLCMGAGMAMAVHGRSAVLSGSALLSMPEVRVGFYPDVGVTFRLCRLPDRLGFYFGITGEPIPPAHAVEFGLARAVVPKSLHAELAAEIARGGDPHAQIARFALPMESPDLAKLSAFCGEVFSAPTWKECSERIAAHRSDIGEFVSKTIRGCSPASLQIAFNALKTAEEISSVSQCLERDMTMNAMILERHDFYEGIRTLLLARELDPVWKDDPDAVWSPEFHDRTFERLKGVLVAP